MCGQHIILITIEQLLARLWLCHTGISPLKQLDNRSWNNLSTNHLPAIVQTLQVECIVRYHHNRRTVLWPHKTILYQRLWSEILCLSFSGDEFHEIDKSVGNSGFGFFSWILMLRRDFFQFPCYSREVKIPQKFIVRKRKKRESLV